MNIKALTTVSTLAIAVAIPANAAQPYYYPAPPIEVYAPPPPNPIAGLIGGLVSLPFVFIGGVASGIGSAFQPYPSCVYDGGVLAPCPPPPYPYAPMPSQYYPSAPAYQEPTRKEYPPNYVPQPNNQSSGACYDENGLFVGEKNPDCANQ
jgi:hypothetical protein